MTRILVSGAGGFIGSHLVRRLKAEGHWVRGVDVKPPQWSRSPADEFELRDLRYYHNAEAVMVGIDWVFALAADMGGAFHAFSGIFDRDIITNNTLIDINTIRAAGNIGIERLLYSSSACIYPKYRQSEPDVKPLKEVDAYPAAPDSIYGWTKLHTEHLCRTYQESTDVEFRVVRFHNVYGIETEWCGPWNKEANDWGPGREKAPAALCRKVARAKLLNDPRIEIWGDGLQTRSFMHIDDCLEGLLRLMKSNHRPPLNLGRDRMVTINRLAVIIAECAGLGNYELIHTPGPLGVRGRNSDNSMCHDVLGWSPTILLEQGIVPTYGWVERQVQEFLD